MNGPEQICTHVRHRRAAFAGFCTPATRDLTPPGARATTPRALGSSCLTTPSVIFSASRPSAKATGSALGCVVDGCPPRIPLTEADIQQYLDKRRPGQSRFTTQRQEPDEVKILSGVFTDARPGRQVTTGTPIALMIENTDQRSKDYSDIKDTYRPGHAGLHLRREIRPAAIIAAADAPRRARPRARVAAGAIARKSRAGPERFEPRWCRWAPTASTARAGTGPRSSNNPFFCPDAGRPTILRPSISTACARRALRSAR